MNKAQQAWENEYATKRLMTGDKPAKSLLKWIKYLKKSQWLDHWDGVRVLDLGSGEGKNALYLAGLGAEVDCIEIARNAVETTKQKVSALGALRNQIQVGQGSIGEAYPFDDDTFDMIIDVTSSNSLSEAERAMYLQESARVLRPGGQMFVRALCKDGDHNAKQLIKDHPGPEHDTYTIPTWGQTERVFSEADIRTLYGEYFDIVRLEKETHYSTFGDRKYKRNFWVMYLENKTA